MIIFSDNPFTHDFFKHKHRAVCMYTAKSKTFQICCNLQIFNLRSIFGDLKKIKISEFQTLMMSLLCKNMAILSTDSDDCTHSDI